MDRFLLVLAAGLHPLLVVQDLVVFVAHTDVVFPDLDLFPVREDEGRLYAPGIGDDTANLVNLLLTACCLIA